MHGKRGPNVWVIRHGTGFLVKLEKSAVGDFASRGATQESAIGYARSLARAFGSELIVQGQTGRIRIKDSHGRDAYPPRG